MEPDKRRTREDTWKSDELKKHLRVSQSDSQSEDKKHKEKKLQREREIHDTVDYKGYRDQDKDRGKTKERTGERERFKSSERDREKLRERERGKDHHREREREKVKDKDAEKEKYSTRREKEKESDKEAQRKQKRDHLKQMLIQSDQRAHEGREKGHHRRRGSKDHLEDNTKARDEEKERSHTERKNSSSKDALDKFLTYRDEGERRHMSHKDQDRERRHREKREHEHSVKAGRERHSKDTSHKSFEKHVEEKHEAKRRQEGYYYESRESQPRENSERRLGEESERKKRDLKNSEHKNQEQSPRQDIEISYKHKRSVKDTEKSYAKGKKEDTKQEIEEVNTYSAEAGYNYSTNYEDDFEDYEDDFDDDDDDDDEGNDSEDRDAKHQPQAIPVSKNLEIEEIQRAINAENERIGTLLPKQILKDDEREPVMERQYSSARGSHCGMFMDFEMANQRQSNRNTASKQKTRSSELLRLIDLDFSVSFSLLDLPPMNEYEMYIRNFGKRNTKQAYVQCNEDNLERDIQTDETETLEKWTQHPGASAIVSGGPRSNSDVSVDVGLTPKIDSQRLANFLRSACQVIAVLLEEDRVATQPRWNLRSRQTSLSISDSCFQLNTNQPFLHDRKVSCLHVSQVQRQALLSVHGLPKKPAAILLNRKYIICVWNVWQPSSPQKVLVCDSEVICCCFSPNKATLVFAGTVDGSLLVWDLREDSRLHHCMKFNETDWIFRAPTFSTDGVLTSVNHTCSVQAIEPVSTSVYKEQSSCGLSGLSSQEEMSGLSFQIASIDESGILNLWVVVELQKVDIAGSQSDLGLIPGGKVKLVHSSTVQLNDRLFPKDRMCLKTPLTLNIKFQPSNPNHFIVGTNIGLVSHGTRHDLRIPPKLFKPQQGGPRSVRVNAVDFSPFGKPIFLVGCSDGSIRLHQMTSEYPLLQWNDSTDGQPVIALQWALTRPAVFLVLDASSNVYVWDLLENDLWPVAKQIIQSDRVLTMAVLGEPEKKNGLLGIVLAKESGIIDIQYIKKKWALLQSEESEKLHLLLQQSL
ncbi:PREDICTED: WD repeat-containing protein 60 isoform X2 [Gavialis gangeticus]|uniref:WD repeat-containing protein 60 isoform X2 n=1 Tax=Gavialis gangeticus TaxID=94835 RepID=UPI00092FCF98|nr:PREDICTED: WD repeat-containing protein 60 isoform X2 [Gavialis gangeticus]